MKKRVVIVCLTLVLLAGAMAAAGLPLESRAAAATPAPAVTPAVTPELPPETEQSEPEETTPAHTETTSSPSEPDPGIAVE